MQITKYYIDGGTCGLNGQGATGVYWSVRRHDIQKDERIRNRFMTTEYTTNNQAEYAALIDTLTYINSTNTSVGYVNIHSDSQLLVKQVQNQWKVKDAILQRLHGIVHILLQARKDDGYDIGLIWLPRSQIVHELGH